VLPLEVIVDVETEVAVGMANAPEARAATAAAYWKDFIVIVWNWKK